MSRKKFKAKHRLTDEEKQELNGRIAMVSSLFEDFQLQIVDKYDLKIVPVFTQQFLGERYPRHIIGRFEISAGTESDHKIAKEYLEKKSSVEALQPDMVMQRNDENGVKEDNLSEVLR